MPLTHINESYFLGRTVVVKSSNSGTRLSKTQLKACFGPRGSFASTLIIHEYTNDQATLELETCSGKPCYMFPHIAFLMFTVNEKERIDNFGVWGITIVNQF